MIPKPQFCMYCDKRLNLSVHRKRRTCSNAKRCGPLRDPENYKNKTRYLPPMNSITCLWCKRPFTADKRARKQRYCCLPCGYAYRYSQKRVNEVSPNKENKKKEARIQARINKEKVMEERRRLQTYNSTL